MSTGNPIIRLAMGCMIIPVAGKAQPVANRPNILIILTDQQSAKMMSCTGNNFVSTPNMDQMASQGIRFTRTYATNPVCVPSRFSLMTGRMPADIGMEGNGHQKNHVPEYMLDSSIGSVFSNAGYETVYAGKMHLTGKDAENGYENPYAYGFQKYITANDKEGREATADACAAYLSQKNKKPFLLVASFINPHDICYLPLLDWVQSENKPNPYPNKKAEQLISELLKLPEGMSKHDFVEKYCPPLPDNFLIPDGELPSFTSNHTNSYIGWARRNYTEDDWRIYRFLYARLTEIVDRQIGQLLDALKESGLEENTLVVFTSDHGDQDASHQLGLKTFLYEESANVPLILKYPGIIKSGVVNAENLVSNGLDLLPTLCDFAGIEIPAGLKGESLKTLATEKNDAGWRKSLVVETGNARLVVMENHMKYMVETGAAGKQNGVNEMLFNLRTDPGEIKNLASDNSFEKFLRKGRKQLEEWYAGKSHKLKQKS